MNIKLLVAFLITFMPLLCFAQTGKVGIGTTNPDTTLHLVGSLKIQDGTEGVLKILGSNANGLASWKYLNEIDSSFIVDSLNIVPRWDGTYLVNGTIIDNGTNIGIGVLNPSEKLEVSGDIKVKNITIGQGIAGNPTNTIMGFNALPKDSLGGRNTGIGFRAFQENTGADNTAVGYVAMVKNTTGNNNTGIGSRAIDGFMTGNWNVAVGAKALRGGAGEENTAVGGSSMPQTTDGTHNTAVGYSSLFQNLSGSYNTAIGHRAGFNSKQSHNVFLGYYAGFFETGSHTLYIDNSDTIAPLIYGEFDTDILRINGTLNVRNEYSFPTTDGSSGQILSTDGNGVLSWGSAANVSLVDSLNIVPRWDGSALVNGTIIDDGTNVGIGTDAPQAKLQVVGAAIVDEVVIGRPGGADNLVVGEAAMSNISTGQHNTAVGKFALQNNDMGVENTSFGHSALRQNTSGGQNTGIGLGALAVNIDGSSNTAVGYTALGESTGGGNTAVGAGAMVDLFTGSENVAIGNGVMPGLDSGFGNTAIGSQSGHNAIGNYNIFIGHRAGYFETGDNKLYIDNSDTTTPLIYGDFDANAITVNGTIHITETAKLTPLTTAPACGTSDAGLLYFDDGLKKLRVCDGTAWQNLH